MSGVHDPLRFGAEEEDLQEEVPLHEEIPLHDEADEPPPSSKLSDAPVAPSAAAAPEVAEGRTRNGLGGPLAAPEASLDPLSAPSTGAAGAGDAHGYTPAQQQPAVAPQRPAAAPRPEARASSSSSREIEADDASLMQQQPSGDGAGPSGAARPPPAVLITVTDPVKRVGDSIIPGLTSGHYEYLVTSVREEPRSRVEVRRRFSDYVALADLLAATHRGYFVYPRPEKSALEGSLGGNPDGFVEARRAELERYLRHLAAHPVVGRSEELAVFLQAEGQLAVSYRWQQLQPMRGTLLEGVARLPRQLLGKDSSVPSTVEAAQNARHTSDLLRRFRELGERMRQEYAAPPVLDDEEVKLREERARVEEYAERLAVASRRAEAVVKEFEGTGAVLGDLGLALIRLAKYEEEEGAAKVGTYTELGVGARAVAADARRAGMAAVRLSRMSRSATGQSMTALEPLHDELAMAPAVAGALHEREAALLTSQSMEEDIEKRKKAVAALEDAGSRVLGGDQSRARKAAAQRNEIAALELALAAAQAEYARVKSRNEEELRRRREEQAADLVRMSRGFGQVNALYGERSLQEWRGIAADFGAAEMLERRLRARRGG